MTVFSCTNDLRPGGTMHYGLRAVEPERLVFISSFSDPAGELVRPPFDEDWPWQLLTTIAFEEQEGGTLVTVRWTPYDATDVERATFEANRDSMHGGWSG